MAEVSYNDLYGLDIDAYCIAHNTSIERLIEKTRTDIRILGKRTKKLANDDVTSQLLEQVLVLKKKKENHLDRLKKWKKGLKK